MHYKKYLRNLCAPFLATLLIRLGFTKRAKKKVINGEFILSVYFHSPDKHLFEFCINWLIKNEFNFLSQEDVYAIYTQSKPFPKAGVIITVDDGWQTNEENIVAIADKYKIPVAIFVSADAIKNGNFWWTYVEQANKLKIAHYSVEALKKVPDEERERAVNEIKKKLQLNRAALTIKQLKNIALSEYIAIGSHSVSHPVLTNCKDEQVLYELSNSKQIIEEWIKKQVVYFAYPNGAYGEREIKYLKELGYALAYTTQPACITKQNLEDIYRLPRFCIFEDISYAEAVCRMLGVWQSMMGKFM